MIAIAFVVAVLAGLLTGSVAFVIVFNCSQVVLGRLDDAVIISGISFGFLSGFVPALALLLA